jgi:hypothetical protein
VVRQLFRIRTYRWIACAHPLYTFASAGILGWLPAFFMRSHGMSVKATGAFFGLSYGFGAAVGLILGGWIIESQTRSRPYRGLYWSGWLMLISFPLYVCAIAVPSLWLSLALMTLFGALIGGAGAPLIAGQQGVVGDDVRAVAAAVSMFGGSYLGAGLGPWLIGIGSQALTAGLADEALRAMLLLSSIAIILCGLCTLRASRKFAADAMS